MDQVLSRRLSFLLFLLSVTRGVFLEQKQQLQFNQIHRSLRKRDLSRIFGVENSSHVPNYEVFTPFLRELSQDSSKNKRDVHQTYSSRTTRAFKMGIPAFDKLHHLNMTQNEQLFSNNFKVEILGKNGKVQKRDISGNCYFHGNVQDDDNSIASMSTCYGQLRGMFTDVSHHYFVEPVPDYLHNVNRAIHEKPHIVFRRSLDEAKRSFSEISKSLFYGIPSTQRTHTGAKRMRRSLEEKEGDVSLDNDERFVEALVVVDQKMVNYHGEDAATQFALVVMNNVARLLRDASIGQNLVILTLNKLQLHTVDVPGLVINHHARNTLKSFGNWAQLSSDVDDRSDDHFDYAILLTRYNICADRNQACDTRGLTETGGMCLWPYSASINEDNGLALVYTVAHNIGHSLGMNHDGDESSFICPDNEFIMASKVTTGDWKDNRNHWSRCSRNYLRQFLKKEQARCLLDMPVFAHTIDYEKMDNKPGILYDIDKQCEMQYGTGSKSCAKNIENVCLSLSCTNPKSEGKCFRSLYPASDGTKCADNKFCFRGKCIGSSSEMQSVDGGWSPWADEYQPCSRSCGGGVQFRQRHCSVPRPSDGGKFCEGDARSYRLCNIQKCNETTTTNTGSFRSIQCSTLNTRLFGERKFEWEFKPSKIASCELGCFISQTGHGYNFGNVADGTNCDQMDDGVFSDKCINGQCSPVGCDKKLGSKAKFDRCGICDGDGLTCVTGTEKSNIAESPNVGGGAVADALKSLHEMGFDTNHLYGNSSKRSDIANKKEEYGWSKIKSGCSMSCGGGYETITAECRRLDDGSPVREDHCDRRSKPPTQQYPCKEEACPPVFQTSYWGDCSKTCNGGFKRRNIRCVQRSSGGIEFDVDSSLCTGQRPADTEGCNKEPCPPEWIAQPFGECSTICAAGVQTRDVMCQKTIKDGTLVTLHHDDCRKDIKPPTEQRCNVHNPCPGDDGCGGIYTDKQGNFTSPGFPDKYPSDMECVHIIQVPKENVIRLNFERMNIASADKECRNDFVKVMDGDCVSRLGESKFCGSSLPPPFISTTNRLCVKFFSDDSKNDQGFMAKYSAVEKPTQIQDQCSSNLTAPDGLVSSPNYPEFYPQNEECNTTITTEEKPIRMKFHAFDVGGERCDTDYLLLSGGEETKKLCGQQLPEEYVSKDNVINLRFISSSHQNQQKPGFIATYTSGSPDSARNKIPKPSNVISKKNNIPNETTSAKSSNFVNSTVYSDAISKDVRLVQNVEILGVKKNSTTVKNDSKILISHGPVAFVKSVETDEIDMQAKDNSPWKNIEIQKLEKEKHLTKEQQLFIDAMKDDTPTWIPEPALQNTNSSLTGSSNSSQMEKSANSSLTGKSTNSSLTTEKNLYSSQIKKSKIPASHKIKLKVNTNKNSTGKHEISKKFWLTRPTIYQNNLDGLIGACPSSLRCMDLLLSYPCNVDGTCGPGLSCCQTSCGYYQKMCLPKVTKDCPLQLPLMDDNSMECQTEKDCPLTSTCCRDLRSKRYCRRLHND